MSDAQRQDGDRQPEQQVDVVVVGLGPGGESVATELARAGLSVVGVDRRLVGGECPYYGCIPSKMMVRAAGAVAEARRVPGLAGSATVEPDWGPVHARVRDEATTDWDDRVAVDRLQEAGVAFVRGTGRLAGPRRVTVEGVGGTTTYAARVGVVLNTGTDPAAPPIDGLAGTPYWTNREALRADTLPASLVVIGGGPIGSELAQVFARFGTRVSLVEVSERILAPEEPEASAVLAEVFARDGIQVLPEARIASVSYAEGRFTVSLADQELTADRLLVAAGRRPTLPDLALDTVGLDPAARSIATDGRMRAGEGLWAVGDITGKGAYTHMSMYQAAIATRDILGQDGPEARYHAVPRVTFTDPEVGSVGLSERQARAAGLDVATGVQDLSVNARGWIAKAEGMVKVVADRRRGVLVGACAMGPGGGEILSMLTTAVHAEIPLATLRSMIYAYPTLHRAVQEALDDLDC